MKWTTKRPTEPGPYWLDEVWENEVGISHTDIVRVSHDFWVCWMNGRIKSLDCINGRWCRIPEPDEGKP
uniref:Uncharacterized protein n=1 Tax=viral metagenome TaxID=1070528 RepID=A0A6M3KZR5_9ZZZZ